MMILSITVTSIAIGWFLYTLIERPFLKLREKLVSEKGAITVSPLTLSS